MGRILLVFLAAVALPGYAQTVQKCVDAKGHVTLTSGACPAGQQEQASYAATPERHDPARARRNAELHRWQREQAARRRPGNVVVNRGGQAEESRHARCEAAKRHRDAEYARLGTHRTFEQSRRLGDYVYERCK